MSNNQDWEEFERLNMKLPTSPKQDTEVDGLIELIEGYISWVDEMIVNPEGLKSALNAHYKSIMLDSLSRISENGYGGGNFRRLIELERQRLESRLGK